jgi:quinol monooxygenase YgiN
MLVIVTSIKVKEGLNGAFEAVFRSATAEVQAHEPDTLMYQLVRSRDDSQAYRLIEMFRHDDALDMHMKMPHVQNMMLKLKGMFESQPQQEMHDTVEWNFT